MRLRPSFMVSFIGVVIAMTTLACAQTPRIRVFRCTPGERLDVGCFYQDEPRFALGSPCSGQGSIRICDASIRSGVCDQNTSLSVSDRGTASCPHAVAYCPESGAVSVTTESQGYSPLRCDWAMRRSSYQSARTASFTCTRGTTVRASCGCAGVGRACEGTPRLLACDGLGSTCVAGEETTVTSNTCTGSCPYVQIICNTGQVTVSTVDSTSGPSRCEFQAIDEATGQPLSASGV